MDATYLGLLAALALGAWFWLDSLRAREIATGICRHACERENLQFLDDTVALARLGVRRDATGQLRWRRMYRFELSDDGQRRGEGHIIMLGLGLEEIRLDPQPPAP